MHAQYRITDEQKQEAVTSYFTVIKEAVEKDNG